MKAIEVLNDAIPDELWITDKRGLTSPENGQKGGAKAKTKEIADSFIAAYPHIKKHRGQYYQFDGRRYYSIPINDLHALIMGHLREYDDGRHATVNMCRQIVEHVGAVGVGGIPANIDIPCWKDYSPASGWVIFKNHAVNIEEIANGNQSTLPHTPELFSTYYLDYEYQPEATCGKWLRYLEDTQPDTAEREQLQMLFGLSLVPDTSFDVFFILYGEGGTGKTVCLEVLTAMVGRCNVTSVPLYKLAEKHSSHLLTENLLNIVGDLQTAGNSQNLSQIEGILKDMASGAEIPIERKGVDPTTGATTARNIFASNSLPNFADRSSGIWDRLRIIPFDVVFRNTGRQNRNLSHEIIKEELPGVLNWAIQGLAKLRNLNSFPSTPKGESILRLHQLACDHEKEFLMDAYEYKKGAYVERQRVYTGYSDFCNNGGYRPKNQANFNKAVKRIFKEAYEDRIRTDAGRINIWANLREKTD